MSYEISQLEMRGLWEVKYFGEVDSKKRNEALKTGLKKAEGNELFGILVDFTDATLTMSAFDSLSFAGKQYKSRRYIGVKTAYLHNPKDTEVNEFLALVMANQGLSSRVFTYREDALEWLMAAERQSS